MQASLRTLLASCVLLVLAACATTPSIEPPVALLAPGETPPQSPALYVVQDADSTLYLYGTVHILPPNTPWGGANAEAALAQADEVWTELEISPASDALTAALALRYGFVTPENALSNRLSPEDYASLEAAAERAGMPIRSLDLMRPWMAALTLSIAPTLEAGFDPQAGVDRAVDAAAEAAGKTMRAFETPEQQMRFFADLSEEAELEMLRDAIEDVESGSGDMERLFEAWRTGDIEQLEHLGVGEMREEHAQLYDVIIRRRNVAWRNTLIAELEGAGVDFVAVGAAHLVGEDGLVDLLRESGYRVTRAGDVTPSTGE